MLVGVLVRMGVVKLYLCEWKCAWKKEEEMWGAVRRTLSAVFCYSVLYYAYSNAEWSGEWKIERKGEGGEKGGEGKREKCG